MKLTVVCLALSKFGSLTRVCFTYYVFHSIFSVKGEPNFGIFGGGEKVFKVGEGGVENQPKMKLWLC